MFYVLDTNALYELYGFDKLGSSIGESTKIDHEKYRQIVEKEKHIIIPTTVLTEAFIRIYDGDANNIDKWYQLQNYITSLNMILVRNGIVSPVEIDYEILFQKNVKRDVCDNLYNKLMMQKILDETTFVCIFIQDTAFHYFGCLLGQPFTKEKGCFILNVLNKYQISMYNQIFQIIRNDIMSAYINRKKQAEIRKSIDTTLLNTCIELYKEYLYFPHWCSHVSFDDKYNEEFTALAKAKLKNTGAIFKALKCRNQLNDETILQATSSRLEDILHKKNYTTTEIKYYSNIQTKWRESYKWDINDLFDSHVLGCLDAWPKLNEFMIRKGDKINTQGRDGLCIVTFDKNMQSFLKMQHPVSYELYKSLLKPES